jgi:hypothetical protein
LRGYQYIHGKSSFTGRFAPNLEKLLSQRIAIGILLCPMDIRDRAREHVSQQDMEESDISRVLFYGGKPPQGSYLSGMAVADHLMQYLQRPKPLARDWKKPNHTPTNLAPNRGLPSQHLSMLLVRSYRTFAPLPRGQQPLAPTAVFFCGTILTIARTGRYPASLAFGVPGLSSANRAKRGRPQLPHWLFHLLSIANIGCDQIFSAIS